MTIVPRYRLISIAAASLGLAASISPVHAAAPTASRAGAAVQGQNQSAESGRRVCVITEGLGSLIRHRVCRTPAQWDRAGGMPTNH